MASFKRRTRAERRNRAKHKLARQIKYHGGFGVGRNSLRLFKSLLGRARNVLGAEWCDPILELIEQYRTA